MKAESQTYFHFAKVFFSNLSPHYTPVVFIVLQRQDEFACNDVYTVHWIVTPILFIYYVCTL